MFHLFLAMLFTQAAPIESYGIPFDDLVGKSFHVWEYQHGDEAAWFVAKSGMACGIELPNGRAAIDTTAIETQLRVYYDPWISGAQVYFAAAEGGFPATMVCSGVDDTGAPLTFSNGTRRTYPSYISTGPEAGRGNRYEWCEFTNAVVWNYSVKYE